MKDDSKVMVWDVTEKIFAHQKKEETTATKTTTSFYAYNEDMDDYLVNKTTTVKPGTFENGDCYETVTTRVFTDYSNSCTKGRTTPIKPQKSMKQSKGNAKQFTIHPNPASNKLQLSIPQSDESSILQVLDLSGSIMVQRKVSANINTYELNTTSLPNGMYIIKVRQGDHLFSSKFVKQ